MENIWIEILSVDPNGALIKVCWGILNWGLALATSMRVKICRIIHKLVAVSAIVI